MTIDETYFNRYSELRELIEAGYVDYYILEGIEDYNRLVQNGHKALPKDSFNVVGHVLEVIKTDLGLTIWKLTENSTDANRIGTLEQYLKEKYELYSTATFSSKTKNTIRKSLHEIRNNALAHNSLVKGNASISVESLKETLEDIRKKLNSLCYIQVDARVKPVDDVELHTLNTHTKLGIRWMLVNSVVPIQQNTKDLTGIDK